MWNATHLRAVRVLSGIRHGEKTGLIMAELEVLVYEERDVGFVECNIAEKSPDSR